MNVRNKKDCKRRLALHFDKGNVCVFKWFPFAVEYIFAVIAAAATVSTPANFTDSFIKLSILLELINKTDNKKTFLSFEKTPDFIYFQNID